MPDIVIEKKGNLYDSLLNEVEKIEAFTTAFEHLDPLEAKVKSHSEILSELTEDELNAYSFLSMKRSEIMMNKYVNSYFAITYAIERHHYRMLNRAYRHHMVQYYPDIYTVFNAVCEHITNCKSHALREEDALAHDCVKFKTHREVVDSAWDQFTRGFIDGTYKPIIVVSHDFERIFTDTYERGRRLTHILNRDITTTTNEYQALTISKCIMRLTACVAVNGLNTFFID